MLTDKAYRSCRIGTPQLPGIRYVNYICNIISNKTTFSVFYRSDFDLITVGYSSCANQNLHNLRTISNPTRKERLTSNTLSSSSSMQHFIDLSISKSESALNIVKLTDMTQPKSTAAQLLDLKYCNCTFIRCFKIKNVSLNRNI